MNLGFHGFGGIFGRDRNSDADKIPAILVAAFDYGAVYSAHREQQRAFTVSHMRVGDGFIAVYGDRYRDLAPDIEFEALDQALGWLSQTHNRYCGVYCSETAIELFTDHASACPLYFSDENGVLRFACSIRDLNALGARARLREAASGRPIPKSGETLFVGTKAVRPGEIVRYRRHPSKSISYEDSRRYFTLPNTPQIYDEHVARQVVLDALSASVVECLSGAKEVGITLSGGVDSAAVAALARPHVKEMYSYTVGTPYRNEFAEARVTAKHLRSRHSEFLMSSEDARATLREAIEAFETWDPVTLQIVLPVCFLYKKLAGRHALLLTGYGSDLIFAGLPMQMGSAAEFEAQLRGDIGLTARTNELSPALADSHSVVVRYPFWSRRVLRDGLLVGSELKTKNREKYILRQAVSPFLPREIAWRPKTAIHDGAAVPTLMAELLGTADVGEQANKLHAIASSVFQPQ